MDIRPRAFDEFERVMDRPGWPDFVATTLAIGFILAIVVWI